MVLEAIRFQPPSGDNPSRLYILDQLLLPHQESYIPISSASDGWAAIKAMRVRGAPAIAIVAALSLAVEVSALRTARKLSSVAEEVKLFIEEKLDYLVTSRPTAVNLADAVEKLKAIIDNEVAKGATVNGTQVAQVYEDAGEKMLEADVADNENIGKHGAQWIKNNTTAGKDGRKMKILTHCNTGSLATAGYGTALGVIRSVHAKDLLEHAFCTETRPYNQGSRLTAFELVHDKIPGTLITDSMAAALMAKEGTSLAAVVVGADRVAANGDTANKIGTYSLAVLAQHHGVKFLVAAPRTTIDRKTLSGANIIIEERAKSEVMTIKGPRVDGDQIQTGSSETISIAATGIDVWNPAFDVTPASLIDGIITEKGVIEKTAKGSFSFDHIFEQ